MSALRAATRISQHAAFSDVVGFAALLALIAFCFGAGTLV